MELRNIRVGIAVVVAALSATAGIGATWGVYSNRLDVIERQSREQQTVINEHDRMLAKIDAQYREILWRLRRIDNAVREDDKDDEVSAR